MKTFVKWILSVVATTAIVAGVVYAASIDSVTTQTISPGSTMGAGWFQAVNDHVNGGGSGSGAGMPMYLCPQYCIRWGPGPWISTQATCNNNYDSGDQACTLIGHLSP